MAVECMRVEHMRDDDCHRRMMTRMESDYMMVGYYTSRRVDGVGDRSSSCSSSRCGNTSGGTNESTSESWRWWWWWAMARMDGDDSDEVLWEATWRVQVLSGHEERSARIGEHEQVRIPVKNRTQVHGSYTHVLEHFYPGISTRQ